MAINRATRYPGRFDDPVAGQPEGAFKNKSGDLAVDGSYLEKDWANDWAAFFSSVLNGTAANGTPDLVGASQLFDGLMNLIVPLGSIVYRSDSTNPGTIYPGTTWVRIAQGRYIASAGSYTDSAGTEKTLTGGNIAEGTYLHTLLEDEMPAHNHTMNAELYGSAGDTNVVRNSGGGPYTTSTTGGGLAHNNMPPGFALFIWERTA